MATTFTNFRAGYLIVSGNNTLVTTGSNEKKVISQFTMYNSSLTDIATVSIWLVGTGTGPVETNILDKVTILPQRSVIVNKAVSQVLNPSFSLIASSDLASTVSVNLSGVSET